MQTKKKSKTPADYEALARKRGFVWVGLEVTNISVKTDWQCGQGHRWQADYNHIRRGAGCPYCSGLARKIPLDYEALARERGFVWLGPEVPTTRVKTTWQCSQGHQWQASYGQLQQRAGCPYCANTMRKTPADYEALARKRGFVWVRPETPTTDLKTTWQCSQGHQWQAPYSRIQHGTGCPYCAGKAPKTPADYEALAKERGFVWLGPEVPTTRVKTTWQCSQGHRWQAHYNAIRNGAGCPYCAGQARKTSADYEALAEKRGFVWLGLEATTTKIKTTWQCSQGHQWQANYNAIRNGTGCPYCARWSRIAKKSKNR